MTIDRTALINNALSFAEKIARKKHRSTPHINYDEIKSAAYMGLVEAANAYDPEESDCFEAFAAFRIVGAIQDYLRELGWGSRRKPLKREYDYVEGACEDRPVEGEFFDRFTKNLPANHKKVMRLYYMDNMKIRDIAQGAGAHESRISQLLSESRTRLRTSWEDRRTEIWAEVA